MYGGGPGGPPSLRLGVRDAGTDGGGLALFVKLRIGSILCIEGSPETGDIVLGLKPVLFWGEKGSLPGMLGRRSMFAPSFWGREGPFKLGIGGGGCLDGGGTIEATNILSTQLAAFIFELTC